MRMAGRRAWARGFELLLLLVDGKSVEGLLLVSRSDGPCSETSSMKFPTARFVGVRGRCNEMEIS